MARISTEYNFVGSASTGPLESLGSPSGVAVTFFGASGGTTYGYRILHQGTIGVSNRSIYFLHQICWITIRCKYLIRIRLMTYYTCYKPSRSRTSESYCFTLFLAIVSIYRYCCIGGPVITSWPRRNLQRTIGSVPTTECNITTIVRYCS